MVADMTFFNRDVSWLAFNERVLMEATRAGLPLMEKLRFLGIYSSNLDEFYRVRVPSYNKKYIAAQGTDVPDKINAIIQRQQNFYGRFIREELIGEMSRNGFCFVYNTAIPPAVIEEIRNYFLVSVAAYLQVVNIDKDKDFFPLNNYLYKAVFTGNAENLHGFILNIPSDHLPRFKRIVQDEVTYLLFLDDIIEVCLDLIFPGTNVLASGNIKFTRDASLKLIENPALDTAGIIEKELGERDRGKATRFLYDPAITSSFIGLLRKYFGLKRSALVEGGRYHNLRDLGSMPLGNKNLEYPAREPIRQISSSSTRSIEAILRDGDILVNTPYQSYETIFRFFNEASLNPDVTEIFITLYRIASDSRIAQALISAAKNGKHVVVVVELKARFDEANNIRWAKAMKAAGVRIIYSENDLKVHAKIALVKTKDDQKMFGLLSTGNFNETTAAFYTDHILITANREILIEVNEVFNKLVHERKIRHAVKPALEHLLVAQFNMYDRFSMMIGREIANAGDGYSAGITIKLNNLEEESLIRKLYEASNAGVKINLVVRGICRLVPGVKGQSENIVVRRIVDRYLEHGRIFIFENRGNKSIYLGSADWMTRNIFHRVEVCFPVYDTTVREQLLHIVALQLSDNVQAVQLNAELENQPVNNGLSPGSSQSAIYDYLLTRNHVHG